MARRLNGPSVGAHPVLRCRSLLFAFRAASQRGSFLGLPAVLLLGIAEPLFGLTKGRGVNNEISLGRQVFDFAKSAYDALKEGGMCSKEAGRLHIALFAGHLIEETDKSFGIVARIPSVLGSQLVRFLLIIAAHAQKGQIQYHTQTEKTVLQGVIGSHSHHTSGKNHGRYLCSL